MKLDKEDFEAKVNEATNLSEAMHCLITGLKECGPSYEENPDLKDLVEVSYKVDNACFNMTLVKDIFSKEMLTQVEEVIKTLADEVDYLDRVNNSSVTKGAPGSASFDAMEAVLTGLCNILKELRENLEEYLSKSKKTKKSKKVK